MGFTVNDVPNKENYAEWKLAIRDQELLIAKLTAQNEIALRAWMKIRGADNEKEYVDKYNNLQYKYQLAKQKLIELKKGI